MIATPKPRWFIVMGGTILKCFSFSGSFEDALIHVEELRWEMQDQEITEVTIKRLPLKDEAA